MTSLLLERLLDVEQERDAAIVKLAEAERRLSALLEATVDADPVRAAGAESLLAQLAAWLNSNPSVVELLPDGFAVRLRAQVLAGKGVRITAHVLDE